MGQPHELTMRIPADTTADAVAWLRALDNVDQPLQLEVHDDGLVTARGGPGSYLVTSAYLRGQVTVDDHGAVLDAVVHKVSHGTIWPWLMAVPAFFLALCSTASLLFDGLSPGPLLIGIPGCLALGYLAWYMVKQNEDHYRSDAATITAALEELFTEASLDLTEE